jgi:hypothetical protein
MTQMFRREAQFQTGSLGFATKIRERRLAMDKENKAVVAVTTFDHNGTILFPQPER